MQRPVAAFSILLALALSAGSALVAVSAPDPAEAHGLSETLRAIQQRDTLAISPLRLVIGFLPMAALAGRLFARRGVWR